jgi:hypothetical protein
MMTLLGILGGAALFAFFGWFTRGRRLSCGSEGSCPSITGGCASCARPASQESEHADR